MEALVESPANGRYQSVSEEKAGGATYTPKILADFVAAQIADAALKGLTANSTLRVLDPAIGDGELLLSLLSALAHLNMHNIDVHGFDTDRKALEQARARICQQFPTVAIHLTHGDFLEFVVDQVRPQDSGGLFENSVSPSFDLIIANPPYVRTQIMGAGQSQLLSAQFGLVGRVDLYHAFIVGIAHVLKPGGIGGIIVSNRFMTTKSGAAVRQAIREHFDIRHIWDLGDTKLFDAAVLPAVLLVARQSGIQQTTAAFTSIYGTNDVSVQRAANPIAALDCHGGVTIDDGRSFLIKNGRLDLNSASEAVWRVANVESDKWLATVEAHTWRRFGDVGKIRVGVKTCADKVFIRSDWDTMPDALKPELLRPLTTHHIARRFKASPAKELRLILYPHQSAAGQRFAADLGKYPRSLAYLNAHRKVLEARSYVLEAGRQWYELWVPQDPASWHLPKLVFRDISEKPTFWMDLEGSVVNGDCYWLASERPDETDLLWLAAAVANSTFLEAFYDRSFNNKLYAGRRRFITQYVERFPLPDPSIPESQAIVSRAKALYDAADSCPPDNLSVELDELVWKVFGLVKEASR